MISIKQIINNLESLLNENIPESINGIFPNRRFLFNIYLDTGDYREAEFGDNLETYYINAQANIATTTGEGLTVDSYNASVSMTLEFLIPFAEYQDEDGNAVVVEAVRDYLGTMLQLAQSTSMTDTDGVNYFVGLQYRIATSGRRDTRSIAGDSMTLLVFADFFISSEGISSSEIEMYIIEGDDPEDVNYREIRVYPTTHGFKRNATIEENIHNGGGSGAISHGTLFTATFEMPVRRNAISFKALHWLFNPIGVDSAFNMKFVFPQALGSSQAITIPMIFDDVSLSCAQNYNANMVCTVKRALEFSEGDQE